MARLVSSVFLAITGCAVVRLKFSSANAERTLTELRDRSEKLTAHDRNESLKLRMSVLD
jgi:hypothetical protein